MPNPPMEYLWISRDDTLARHEGGMNPQVWSFKNSEWRDYPRLDWMHEGTGITEAEAQAIIDKSAQQTA